MIKTSSEVQAFYEEALGEYPEGNKAEFLTRCFEAGVARAFWDMRPRDVNLNERAFEGAIKVYCQKRGIVLQRGYGLALTGCAGSGKTTFLSMILTYMLSRDHSAYYTTARELDGDLKASFGNFEYRRLLDKRLQAQFVVIDDLGDERTDSGGGVFERFFPDWFKRRGDNRLPVLLGSRLGTEELLSAYPDVFGGAALVHTTIVRMKRRDGRRTSEYRREQELGVS